MKDEVNIFASDKIKDFMKTRLYVCVCMLLLMFSCDNLNVNQRLEEYAKYYGPLTIDTTKESCADRWSWINEPWPWQEGGC